MGRNVFRGDDPPNPPSGPAEARTRFSILATVGLGGPRYLTIGLGTDETLVGVDDHSTWAYRFPVTDVEE
ncbi:hypothetical protein [Frankia gtarii]|uniref:hypothetical protein n=1 Tax=Frankia gtarii TaxID=2950102 RepID=UPI0021BE7271|nr:hypothetical protein [Frankia gtarii]